MISPFDDKEWLAGAESLGPWARLALGTLLANDRRSWFRERRAAALEIESCVPKDGLLKWGGDATVLTAHTWLPPEAALEIGRRMREVKRMQPLRVQVQRQVFDWDLGEFQLGHILDDLSLAVGYERVSLEWPKRVHRSFPSRSNEDSESLLIGASPELSVIGNLSQKNSSLGKWDASARVADVYVVEEAKDLNSFDSARMVIAFTGSLEKSQIADSLVMLRGEKLTRCVIEVDADASKRNLWLASFFDKWSREGVFLDEALASVNRELGSKSRVLSSTMRFIRWSSSILRPFEKAVVGSSGARGPEARSGMYDQPIPVAVGQSKGYLPDRDSRPPPQIRVLDAVVRQDGKSVKELPKEGVMTISLSVLIKGPWHLLVASFPDDDVEWEGESKSLQAHMFELGKDVVSKEMVVPRKGNSKPCDFEYKLQGNELDLRFMLTDGPRILQTARLTAKPGERIDFHVEAVAQSVLRNKAAFDVALLVNDSLGSSPSITSISSEAVEITALSDTQVDTARAGLLDLLYDLVNRPKEPLAPAMMKLASQGRLLLRHLKSHMEGWPERMERVQLITQSDAFFPMEYLYDGRIPDSPDAPLCGERHACLVAGKAIPDCTIREARKQLCPMGFLGLTAIIERHTWRKEPRKGMWMTTRLDQVGRVPIKELSKAALSASNRADQFSAAEVPAGTEVVKVSDIAKLLQRQCLTNWKSWVDAVQDDSPSLLVMLLHTDETMLSIGEDQRLMLGALDTAHVGAGNPVVVAIGCNTGASKMAGSHLPALLIEYGAQLVFAAMTNVLGRHAVRAARDVTVGLRQASESSTATTVGELISRVRGRLLKDDIALGLTLIAFGDADVVLGGV